jgi:hypothetical protein
MQSSPSLQGADELCLSQANPPSSSACARKSLRSVSALLSALVLGIGVKTLRNDLRFPALVVRFRFGWAGDGWLVAGEVGGTPFEERGDAFSVIIAFETGCEGFGVGGHMVGEVSAETFEHQLFDEAM